MIKISIVTISYNQAKYLEKAICSVLDQDYPLLEYIVVDPGSTDGSREIIESYADRIHKIIFEPDNGPADGLNKGFAQATGEVFGYINADDILLPGALAEVAAYFEAHAEIDVLLGNGVQLNDTGVVTRTILSTKWDLRRYVYCACAMVQQANFFRAEAFEKTGGFNTDNITCWDWELLLDMAVKGAKFMNVEDFWGGFRLYPESITGSGRMNLQFRIDIRRNFRKIMGRDFRWTDEVLRFFYRSTKKLNSLAGQLNSSRILTLRLTVF
jgi:glycosyltransferase involved in cell wall biosynthesis